jgi:hypothetical protein
MGHGTHLRFFQQARNRFGLFTLGVFQPRGFSQNNTQQQEGGRLTIVIWFFEIWGNGWTQVPGKVSLSLSQPQD